MPSDEPVQARASRAASSPARVPADDAWRLTRSSLNGRLQVAFGTLTIAECLNATSPVDVRMRENALLSLVNASRELERVLNGLDALLEEAKRANAFRASWERPAAIPAHAVNAASGIAVGARRAVTLAKASIHAP